ncbi:Bacteriocin-type signal sequence-containing protein [Flavobacterium chungbukense]|uniref:Bacteriocin n=1 Tax=Flavobacterium chungbukense TaxID=877464 RepID=A0ABP7XWT2_9FLAO
MLKEILSLKDAHRINKSEQKNMKGGIPECWVYALEAGCILISPGETCPINTTSGICNTSRLCC